MRNHEPYHAVSNEAATLGLIEWTRLLQATLRHRPLSAEWRQREADAVAWLAEVIAFSNRAAYTRSELIAREERVLLRQARTALGEFFDQIGGEPVSDAAAVRVTLIEVHRGIDSVIQTLIGTLDVLHEGNFRHGERHDQRPPPHLSDQEVARRLASQPDDRGVPRAFLDTLLRPTIRVAAVTMVTWLVLGKLLAPEARAVVGGMVGLVHGGRGMVVGGYVATAAVAIVAIYVAVTALKSIAVAVHGHFRHGDGGRWRVTTAAMTKRLQARRERAIQRVGVSALGDARGELARLRARVAELENAMAGKDRLIADQQATLLNLSRAVRPSDRVDGAAVDQKPRTASASLFC